MRRRSFTSRRALALVEVLVLVAIVGAVIAILALAAHDSRRRSRHAGSMANLHFFAAGTQSYAADNANKFWTYSWRAGTQNTEYTDLNFAFNDVEAASNQAVYIIRTIGESPQMPRIIAWVPHIKFSHLMLWHHLGMQLPARMHVSPEDRTLLRLQSTTDLTGSTVRQAYASSYEIGAAFYSPDAVTIVNGVTTPTVAQATTHNIWTYSTSTPFGYRTLDEVRFPAHKAHMWDSHQRDLGSRVLFFAMPDARVPVLTVDGSAGLRSAADTNPGFRPNQPTSPEPTTFNYAPSLITEPPAQDPSGQDTVIGRMRWTRWGLRGRDFNGPEATGP